MTGTVTVHGVNFGYSDSTPSSRLDLIDCATTAWASATSLNCYSLSGPSSVSTEVTVGGLAGTRFAAFTFDGVARLPGSDGNTRT